MWRSWTEGWPSQWQLFLFPIEPESIFFTELCYKSRKVITHKEGLEIHCRLATSPWVTLLQGSKRSLIGGPSSHSEYLKSLVSCHWSQDSSPCSKWVLVFSIQRGMDLGRWKLNACFPVLRPVQLATGRKRQQACGCSLSCFMLL